MAAQLKHWEHLHKTADEMWSVGVAVIVTAIWRWNVDRCHPDGRKEQKVEEAVQRAGGAIVEAYNRYSLGLLPYTTGKVTRIRLAEAIDSWTRKERNDERETERETITRVGFFDGGSRGNPEPGGSGSVIV